MKFVLDAQNAQNGMCLRRDARRPSAHWGMNVLAQKCVSPNFVPKPLCSLDKYDATIAFRNLRTWPQTDSLHVGTIVSFLEKQGWGDSIDSPLKQDFDILLPPQNNKKESINASEKDD